MPAHHQISLKATTNKYTEAELVIKATVVTAVMLVIDLLCFKGRRGTWWRAG